MKASIPFGLLFEENVRSTEVEAPRVIYSSTKQMSYAVLDSGELEPYVVSTCAMGTETFTKVRAEGTVDDDQNVKMFARVLGTETATKVASEATDSDERLPPLGTETITEVRSENTDSDR